MALEADFIASLLKKDSEPKPRTGGGRPKGDPTEPRVFKTWWTFHHKFGICENPDCLDDRPPLQRNPLLIENLKTHEIEEEPRTGTAMVAEVKGKKMCRICFLSGWLSDAASE